jgi:hypothetical protein
VRRSSVVILSIMLVTFGAIMAAGGTALKPLAQDADASKVLTRHLVARGDIEEGTKVRLSRLPASDNRLAQEGRGLVIQLTPSAQVTGRRGALRLLVLRVATEGLGRFPGRALDWVEVGLEIRQPDGSTQPLRTLLPVRDGEGLGKPQPPLPPLIGAPPRG